MPPAKKSKTSNFFSKGAEIRRSNLLRVRIRTYCKQEKLTQPQFGEKLGCSPSQMNSFMTGMSLTGSSVYIQGMKYLRTRMPVSKCSPEDLMSERNDKFVVSFGGGPL